MTMTMSENPSNPHVKFNTIVMGHLTKDIAGGVDVELTEAEAQYAQLTLSGALTANINVVVPAPTEAKKYTVRNSTTGAYTLTFKTPAGAGVVLTQGRAYTLGCDATDIFTVEGKAGDAQAAADAALAGVATMSWEIAEERDLTAGAQHDFTLDKTQYAAWRLELLDETTDTDGDFLFAQLGYGAGPTFRTVAGDYTFTNAVASITQAANPGGVVFCGGASANEGIGNAAGEAFSATVEVDGNAGSAATAAVVKGSGSWVNQAGEAEALIVNGLVINTAPTEYNTLRMTLLNGQFGGAGTAVLHGLRWTSYQSAVYTDELEADAPDAWWWLNDASGSGAFADWTTNHPATVSGDPTFEQPGLWPGSYSVAFDGTGDYGTTAGVVESSVTNFTIETSIQYSATTGQMCIYNGGDGTNPGLMLMANGGLSAATGKIAFALESSGNYIGVVTNRANLNDGQKHLIQARFTGSANVVAGDFIIRIDGVEETVTAESFSNTHVTPYTGGVSKIGKHYYSGYSEFNGKQQHVWVKKAAVSNARLDARYAAWAA